MTSTTEEIDLSQLFEFSINCEHPKGCDREAKWVITNKCCNGILLICTHHAIELKEVAARMIAEKAPGKVVCRYCKASVPATQIFDLIDITPL